MDSGYSIDNFPLPPPTNVVVNVNSNVAQLSWNRIQLDSNFLHFAMYRLAASHNGCESQWQKYLTTTDTILVDPNYDSTSIMAYRVSSVKRNLNEWNSDEIMVQGTVHKYQIELGWNMMSLPLLVLDNNTSNMFHDAVTGAFTFQNGYVPRNSFECGTGYWLKFLNNQEVVINGAQKYSDTFYVNSKWNMIGSISVPIPVQIITSIPEGMVTSQFFAYSPSTGYITSDTVKPGFAYWVKTTQQGKLVLSNQSPIGLNRIKIITTNELPPPPPETEGENRKTEIPYHFALEQNYPNPFNPVTVIRYAL
ncbi:MAG: hypothetical protein HYZ34_06480, partial [Ignavibacteriae bacterium]|nr:hypothetical protein [Ignavibacteriota bacterium]